MTLGARVLYLAHLAEVPRLASEGPVLYSIWKIRHGYPLYESPFAPFFPVTLYNFLSYETYAAAFRAFGVTDAWTPVAGRVVTAAFGVAGALLQYLAARELLGARGDRRLIVLLTIVTWTGTVLPGSWTLAIRPDVGAVALDLAGICGVLRVLRAPRVLGAREGLERPKRLPAGASGGLIAAGLMFYGAWAFKQSHVVVAGTTAVYLLVWRRSWREAALVAAPFVLGVAVTLAIGGPIYRQNIIDAPALSPLLSLYAWFGARTIALPEAPFWAATAIAMAALLADPRAMTERSLRVFGVDLVYPLLLTLAAGAAAVPMLAKAGSAINHAIELKVCAALVTAGVLGGARMRGRAVDALVAAAAAVALLSHVSRATAERGLLEGGVRGTDPSAASRRATAETIARLPRPVYAEDELYALPWIANGNAYPAIIPDYQVYHAAKDAGVLSDTTEAMVARGVFGSLAVADTSPLVSLARQSGYELIEVVPQVTDRPIAILRRR